MFPGTRYIKSIHYTAAAKYGQFQQLVIELVRRLHEAEPITAASNTQAGPIVINKVLWFAKMLIYSRPQWTEMVQMGGMRLGN